MNNPCLLCQAAEGVHRLQYDSMNGPCDWRLCAPCLGSRLTQQWQTGRNYIVDGTALKTEKARLRFVDGMQKSSKCAGCGSKCVGFHWHFGNSAASKGVARDGRRYYCDRTCCPTCEDDDPMIDWEDEDDEFMFDDEEDDEFVFGDEEDEEDDWDL